MTDATARMRARAYLALMAGKTIRIRCRFEGRPFCDDGDRYCLIDNRVLAVWDDILYEWSELPTGSALPETMTSFQEDASA